MGSFRVFMTGVTGYIGGDVLFLLAESHPEWQITCLVRDRSKTSDLMSRYPRLRIVHGSLDASEVIEEEVARADLIYHLANSDHQSSAYAISRGLARAQASPVYWIHTSGAGILTHQNFALRNFESMPPDARSYDDWKHVDELTSLPDRALHRHVDKIVLDASSGRTDHVKTAIISPPAIYGLGRGTGNVQSVQVNVAVRIALRNGRAVQMGDGSNTWHAIHIRDLSQLYLLLGEAAALKDPRATWNSAGYYLAENQIFKWGDVTQAIADESQRQGYLATNELENATFERAQDLHKNFPYLCGTTSLGSSKRAKILLEWKPKERSLREELPLIIDLEAKSLGLRPKYKGNIHLMIYKTIVFDG